MKKLVGLKNESVNDWERYWGFAVESKHTGV